MFLVDARISGNGEIEIALDSDTRVGIDACVELSRAIEAHFGDEMEDYSLVVASAGIGQPLKMLRQYKKLIGKAVEVVLKSGTKITAELTEATEEAITLRYDRMEVVEGKKRKQKTEVVETYALADVKSTVEHLDFK